MRLVLDKQAQEREKSGLPVPLSHHFPVMGVWGGAPCLPKALALRLCNPASAHEKNGTLAPLFYHLLMGVWGRAPMFTQSPWP